MLRKIQGGADVVTCAAAGYVVDDSDHDFDPTDATAGGKLTMEVVPFCIPVNEVILYNLTFEKIWFNYLIMTAVR